MVIGGVDYASLEGSFYDDQTNPKKSGLFRAWLHTSRYVELNKTIHKYFKKGDRVVDLACGSCNWNVGKLPVVGVDINEDLLKTGKKHGLLKEVHVGDIYKIPLPKESADIIIMTEILEHVEDLPKVLKEVDRVLKKGGKLITTVPYDSFPSPHFPMFFAHCLYKGFIKKDPYYKKFCGHINHFSMRKMRNLLTTRFKVIEQFPEHMLHIFTVAQKG